MSGDALVIGFKSTPNGSNPVTTVGELNKDLIQTCTKEINEFDDYEVGAVTRIMLLTFLKNMSMPTVECLPPFKDRYNSIHDKAPYLFPHDNSKLELLAAVFPSPQDSKPKYVCFLCLQPANKHDLIHLVDDRIETTREKKLLRNVHEETYAKIKLNYMMTHFLVCNHCHAKSNTNKSNDPLFPAPSLTVVEDQQPDSNQSNRPFLDVDNSSMVEQGERIGDFNYFCSCMLGELEKLESNTMAITKQNFVSAFKKCKIEDFNVETADTHKKYNYLDEFETVQDYSKFIIFEGSMKSLSEDEFKEIDKTKVFVSEYVTKYKNNEKRKTIKKWFLMDVGVNMLFSDGVRDVTNKAPIPIPMREIWDIDACKRLQMVSLHHNGMCHQIVAALIIRINQQEHNKRLKNFPLRSGKLGKFTAEQRIQAESFRCKMDKATSNKVPQTLPGNTKRKKKKEDASGKKKRKKKTAS